MSAAFRLLLLAFLLASVNLAYVFQFDITAKCTNYPDMKGRKKLKAKVYAGETDCGWHVFPRDGHINFTCYAGIFPRWMYVPQIYLYHSCDGVCRQYKFWGEKTGAEVTSEGETLFDRECEQEVWD
ncbi:unnamed protein product [Bursaphelenchus xylophilus]|uniref:(pine wood nematode) hypothetical protein n=1 Tax=Bursaphelenchus xylophilus TaxID=6326 RepID=A0A1I7RVS4_BURXY|nr:unnamed protein product [Bursaphelenchus xylophilus]CAG9082102.1 unnamed protein product [Bursaphelenchus xylophilus]